MNLTSLTRQLGSLACAVLLLSGLAAVATSQGIASGATTPSGSSSITDDTHSDAGSSELTRRTSPSTAKVRYLLRNVRVGAENRDGYLRETFPHWTDADGNCLDARHDVLAAESRTTPLVEDCRVTSGTWLSYYDRVTTTDPSTLDIDHLVPLAEAWDSGASSWDEATRTRYANDTEPRSLVAVSASSNRSKSDSDPADWMPRYGACRYLVEWVATKVRWQLSVDPAEKKKLRGVAAECPNKRVTINPAAITYSPEGPDEPEGGDASSVQGLQVRQIVYDPPGADTDPNDETLLITNTSEQPAHLRGTSVRDAADHVYVFINLVLAAGASVRVHSGEGIDTETGAQGVAEVYAGWGAVWNNTGDSFELRDSTGALVDSGSYTDATTSDTTGTATFG